MNDLGEFLLHLRDDNPNIVDPREWSFIGGGCELNEDSLTALKREINEEIPGCFVQGIEFVGNGYAEIDINRLRTVDFSINQGYKKKNLRNLLLYLEIFKGKINHDIEYINQRLTEGQGARYFRLEALSHPAVSCFSREFIYQNKDKLLTLL